MTKDTEEAIIIPPKAVAEYSLKDAALQELSAVEKGLGELKTSYAGKVYDVTNATGMAQAKHARLTIREVRYKIPKIIDEKKRLIKAAIKEMEASGATITEELFKLENPIHDQIQAEEERAEAEKERKREEARLRLQKITESIEKIKLFPIRCAGMKSDQLSENITFVEELELTEAFYQEFLPSALEARTTALQEMIDLRSVAIELEQAEADRLKREEEERKEQERLQQEERDRLAEQQKEIDRQNEELRLQREKFEQEQAEANREKEEKEARERKEREDEEKRCDAIAEKISAIRNKSQIPAPHSLNMIQAAMDEVNAIPITEEEFGEFMYKAATAKDETLAALSIMFGNLKQYIEREEQQQRDRDELKRQQDQMAETLRLQEEEQERERLRLQSEKEEKEREEAERLEELRRNHKRCACPFCQGVEG